MRILNIENLIKLARFMRPIVVYVTLFAYLNAFVLPITSASAVGPEGDDVKIQRTVKIKNKDKTSEENIKSRFSLKEAQEESEPVSQSWWGMIKGVLFSPDTPDEEDEKPVEQCKLTPKLFNDEIKSLNDRLSEIQGTDAEEKILKLNEIKKERKTLKKKINKTFNAKEDRQNVRKELNKIGSIATKKIKEAEKSKLVVEEKKTTPSQVTLPLTSQEESKVAETILVNNTIEEDSDDNEASIVRRAATNFLDLGESLLERVGATFKALTSTRTKVYFLLGTIFITQALAQLTATNLNADIHYNFNQPVNLSPFVVVSGAAANITNLGGITLRDFATLSYTVPPGLQVPNAITNPSTGLTLYKPSGTESAYNQFNTEAQIILPAGYMGTGPVGYYISDGVSNDIQGARNLICDNCPYPGPTVGNGATPTVGNGGSAGITSTLLPISDTNPGVTRSLIIIAQKWLHCWLGFVNNPDVPANFTAKDLDDGKIQVKCDTSNTAGVISVQAIDTKYNAVSPWTPITVQYSATQSSVDTNAIAIGVSVGVAVLAGVFGVVWKYVTYKRRAARSRSAVPLVEHVRDQLGLQINNFESDLGTEYKDFVNSLLFAVHDDIGLLSDSFTEGQRKEFIDTYFIPAMRSGRNNLEIREISDKMVIDFSIMRDKKGTINAIAFEVCNEYKRKNVVPISYPPSISSKGQTNNPAFQNVVVKDL